MSVVGHDGRRKSFLLRDNHFGIYRVDITYQIGFVCLIVFEVLIAGHLPDRIGSLISKLIAAWNRVGQPSEENLQKQEICSFFPLPHAETLSVGFLAASLSSPAPSTASVSIA